MCGCANQWANGSMHYFVRSPEKSDTMKGVKALKVGLRRTWGPAVPGAIVGGESPANAARPVFRRRSPATHRPRSGRRGDRQVRCRSCV